MTIAKLSEAKALAPNALTGKSWKIKIIEGDRQGSSAYYPKEALESGKHLFSKGVRIFRNHPSESAKWEQPERKIEDIIGWLTEDATYDGKDLYANVEFLESEQARIKQLAEAGVIGMSIRATGEMTEGANGMELKKFTSVNSVDVVTQAGAGGKFVEVLESARNPEAVEAENEEESKLEFPKELAEAMDTQTKLVNSLLEKLNAREDAEAAKAAALEEADRVALEEAGKPKVASASEIAAALVEADLAPKARARVLKAVEAGADLAESIAEEKEIAAEVLESAGGNGGGHFDGDTKLSEAERGSAAAARVFG